MNFIDKKNEFSKELLVLRKLKGRWREAMPWRLQEVDTMELPCRAIGGLTAGTGFLGSFLLRLVNSQASDHTLCACPPTHQGIDQCAVHRLLVQLRDWVGGGSSNQVHL